MPAEATYQSSRHAGPLAGLRILDLSTYVAGPSGAMCLAQLGAEVVRIDPPGGATDVRRLPLSPEGTSLYWIGLNKGKRSVVIDTTTVEGREVVGRLLDGSGPGGGIVLTNAVGQDWMSFERMSAWREDLIMVHIEGRHDGRPAVDYTVNCEVGLPLMTGPADFARPVNHVLPAWDLLTGLHAAIAILTAERTRWTTGGGQLVSLSLADVAVATMAHLGFVADVAVNGRGRLRDGNYLYGSFGCDFETSDGQRVMIVALTERHWRKLVELTGISEAILALEKALSIDLSLEEGRYRYRTVLEALIAPWFAERSFADATAGLERARVLWGPYRTVESLVADPTSIMHASGVMVDLQQAGVGKVPTPRSVLNFSGWDDPGPTPAPVLGQDTNSVLSAWAGLSETELGDLRARRLIGGEA
jgi:2-methylfumaryl-CoA isomerase